MSLGSGKDKMSRDPITRFRYCPLTGNVTSGHDTSVFLDIFQQKYSCRLVLEPFRQINIAFGLDVAMVARLHGKQENLV